MGEMTERLQDINKTMEYLGSNQPDAMKHFKRFMGATGRAGALDVKTKELISLGASITVKCKYCITIHVRNSLEAGATVDEIYEASMVAVLMGGTPAMAYITDVRKALEEFME